MDDLNSNNLVVEFQGQKYIVDATANDVCEKPMPILIRPYPGEKKFVSVGMWLESMPPQARDLHETDHSEVYYNAVRLLD
jgi:hypothetical protein